MDEHMILKTIFFFKWLFQVKVDRSAKIITYELLNNIII